MAPPRQTDSTGFIARLSPRELEVLALMAAAYSNVAIAQDLGLSLRGVEKHISEIYRTFELGPDPRVQRRVRAVLLFQASGT